MDACLSALLAEEPSSLFERRARLVARVETMLAVGEPVLAASAGLVYLDAIAVVVVATPYRVVGVGQRRWQPQIDWQLDAGYGQVTRVTGVYRRADQIKPSALVVSGHHIRLTSPLESTRRFVRAVRGQMGPADQEQAAEPDPDRATTLGLLGIV